MKKQIRILIILFIILVIIILGNVIIKHVTSKNNVVQPTTSEAIKINDYTDISEISFNNGKEDLTFKKTDDSWTCVNHEDINISKSIMTSIEDDYKSLKASRKINDCDTLESYGLDKPAYEVNITDSNGKTQSIKIGNKYGNEYYIIVDDNTDTVYTCTFNHINYLSEDIDKFSGEEETTTATLD